MSADDKQAIRSSWDKWDIIGTLVVFGLVVGMYLYFSFWLLEQGGGQLAAFFARGTRAAAALRIAV